MISLEKKLDWLKEVWQQQEDYQYLMQRDMWREGEDKQIEGKGTLARRVLQKIAAAEKEIVAPF